MRPILVKIIPIENYYQLIIQGGWINEGRPFGLRLSNGELSPEKADFVPLISLIDPYLTEIQRVIESGEYVPNKRIGFPIKTDGWVK